MTTLHEAAQQALEALEYHQEQTRPIQKSIDAIKAVEEALRLHKDGDKTSPPLAEQMQEPVAWAGYDLDAMVEAFSRVIEAHHASKHPFHNPIDMDARMALRILRGFIPAMKASTAPPQRKPLTEEEIDCIWATEKVFRNIYEITRAIERAHGIGDDK